MKQRPNRDYIDLIVKYAATVYYRFCISEVTKFSSKLREMLWALDCRKYLNDILKSTRSTD